MSLNTIDSVRGTATGTETTPVVISTYTIPSGAGAAIRAIVQGRDTLSGDIIVTEQFSAVKNVNGTTTIVGSKNIIDPITDTSLLTASTSILLVGGDISFQATGVTGTSIEWMADITIDLN